MNKSIARALWMFALLLSVVGMLAAQQIPQTLPQDDHTPSADTNPDYSSSQPQENQDNQNGVPTVDGSVAVPADASANSDDDAGQLGASGPADQFYPKLDDAAITQIGAAMPIDANAAGKKLGPFLLTNISDSFFYAVQSITGEPTQTLPGNTLSGTLIYNKTLGRGTLGFQTIQQFSNSGTQPFYNQVSGLSFTEQLTERWTLSAGLSLIYFQNYVLANPQYIYQLTNNGIVAHTLLAQQIGNTTYISNNLSASYSISGTTTVSFTPVLSSNFLNQVGGWSYVNTLGGGVSVTHSFDPTLSAGVFYSLAHSFTGGVANSSAGWNSQSLGVNFRKTWGRWSLGGSAAASFQSIQLASWAPTGNLYLSKSFRWNGVLSAAYTRSEAAQVYASSGYYDQGDMTYRQRLNKKSSFNVGVGAFRTIDSLTHVHGKRAGGSFNYQWLPRVSLTTGYSYGHTSGTESTFYLGNTQYFTFGVNWRLGGQPGS